MKWLFLLLLPVFAHAQSQGLKYEWRKISGPSQYKIVSPNSAVTNVTDLAVGVYKFELKVTNSKGLSSRDTMVLTVAPADTRYAKNAKKISPSVLLGSKKPTDLAP